MTCLSTKRLLLLTIFLASAASAHDMAASEAKKTLNSLGVDYSVSELCTAVKNDNLTIVRLFHVSGVDIETQCYGSKTLLYMAVDWGSYKTYRYLISTNADVNVAGSAYTILTRAISHRQYDMVYELLRLGALAHQRRDSSALAYALLDCDPVLVAALLENGASPEERYPYANRSPLQEAAGDGCVHATEHLLAAGADVNAETDYGQTALIRATARGSADVVRVLLEAGAVVDHRADHGATALLFAVSKGHLLVVLQLLQAGADPNQVYTMSPDVTPFAVPNNSRLREAIQVGATPLMLAASRGDLKIVKQLVEYGADPAFSVEVQNEMYSASTIALASGFKKLARFLDARH